ITIDGVRVAFFDAEGNYLQPMEQDELLWVPLNALCENLGKTAQVQGQSILVDGLRVGMFDENGNFLIPAEISGAVYVPVVAFCESLGIEVVATENGVAIARGEIEGEIEPEHPEYVAVDLNLLNFDKYFSYSISVENFKNWEQRYKVNHQTLSFQYWSCDYVLRATSLTPYKFENVRFDVTNPGVKANAQYGAKGITFTGVTMPQSGEVTRRESYEDSYMSYSAIINSSDDVLNDTADMSSILFERGYSSVNKVSGRIFIPWEDAQGMLESKYQSAQKVMDEGDYQSAVNIYKELAEAQYKDAAQLLPIAEEKLAAQKAKKQQDDYAAAQAALESGDFDAAIKGFKALGDYSDSQAKLAEANDKKYAAQYEEAVALENSGKYDEAIAIYNAMKGYQDSAQRAAACEEAKELAEKTAAYAAAEALETAGDYIGAYDAFIALGDFEDSAPRAEKLLSVKTYQQIENLMAEGKYGEAQALLAPLSHEEKAQQLILTCNLRGLGNLRGFTADGTSWVEVRELDENGLLKEIKGVGLMDIHGNLILPVETFDTLVMAKSGEDWVSPNWQDGLCLVKTAEGPYGYVNARGEMAIPAQYLYAQAFHQGAALVRTQGKKYQVIDTQGKVLCELPDKKGRDYIAYVGEGLISYKEKGKVGLLNLKGKVVLKPKYESSISLFNNGIATAQGMKKNTFTYARINPKGKEVKLGKYKEFNALSENVFSVFDEKKKLRFLVDQKGKSLTPAEYKDIFRSGDLLLGQKNGKWGALDLNLQTVIPFEWENIFVGYESKVVALKKDSAYQLYSIDNLQTPLIEKPSYTVHLTPDSPYIAWYDNDLGWFVYDSEGSLIH
ncbi:MAG: WG repeat-containing protein, partial [Clostridia bacterium]|nr:WG repeat-containing protein [Clostridia bacterium]